MRRTSSRFASAADLQSSAARQHSFRLRLLALAALVLFCFALLAWRWVILQVLRRESYMAQAESNRTALVPVPPSRGTIMDRNGVVLASNCTKGRAMRASQLMGRATAEAISSG